MSDRTDSILRVVERKIAKLRAKSKDLLELTDLQRLYLKRERLQERQYHDARKRSSGGAR